ncbi:MULTISPECIES: carboxymuconolactone decarboxylase family protein [Brevibacillus]|uniref:Alkylhydroperoxidase n=1 Tax=Brevibacillus porteri TaxID=2126350 RepID=A0ABX5FXI2_9BACL|nr:MULTISPECIES: carboxymuconolactone decarboxylase family protein [Brevibacillus]MED1916626.1 carboxymuconolactone decarboxylase family protein [Bacillus thuringiensis]MED1799770.1 carboxymuconolactone decarboxylase family protein [Brevibacillus porteri]MED2131041.1 carboxymuconolactone decarboxylase family protein [Brevibacillus porteri]MED2744293.1 carboxymuconolactone decarboxylase family protein [Brevibacillus porteri]MED2816667.1 carboxymuconolactone decarboxylase family protein [Breviba
MSKARSYYESANLSHIPELMKLAPEAAASYFSFERQIYQQSHQLPVKTKELIAIVVAHVTGCPYCIDVHVKKYKELGGTMEEIMEALLVAAVTRSGAILSHGVNALLAYRDAPGKPDCFC